MPHLDPAQRRLIATQAAHTSWAKTPDRDARLRPARDGLLRRFEKQVDPDGTLTPDERAKRAESARRAFYLELSRKGNAARRAKKVAQR